MYVSYLGELFLRALKALILPLIVPSLITAVGSLDMSLSGRVGGRAILYYLATTVLAGVMLLYSLLFLVAPSTVLSADTLTVKEK